MLLLYFQLISFVTSSTLGVDPKQESLFANKLFKCFDGSKSISISSVNDDYCDCLDGSDEPGRK